MASSYPHSMTPCRWFSNRKDCIWKHKPTIYTKSIFCWILLTLLVRIATLNWSLFLTHRLATKTVMLEKDKKKMSLNLVVFTVNKSTTSLYCNATPNDPFSHNATFKSIIWTRQSRLRQRQQADIHACESTTEKQSEEMLPLVSVRTLIMN